MKVYVVTANWCDDWRVLAVAKTEALARKIVESAHTTPWYEDAHPENTVYPHMVWVDEVELTE